MWQEDGDESPPYEGGENPKGDEIQKLSVIQSLPSLLITDSQSCMTRVVPKMQQSLAGASTEFHMAASSTFKTILEQKLVTPAVFSQTFLQSILNSLESRDSIVRHEWLATLLDVIELLPTDVIRMQILPMTINKGQLCQPTHSRITCSGLLGKICTRFDSSMIQKEVLPTVQSLCQDVNSEVRASICLQLRFVAEGLGAECVKPALLPSLVELASDEESDVRCASIQTIVHILPHLQEDTIKTTIAPLVKKLCESASKSDDNVICNIAQSFGKLVIGLEKSLLLPEKLWFIKYFQQMSQMGIPTMKKEYKSDLPFASSSPSENERCVECRRYCAYNLPALFIFTMCSGEDVDILLPTLNALACDPYYMVRRTVACGLHEVAKILGVKSGRIRGDFVKLLKNDAEEVLQGLVPHIAATLECLVHSQTLGTERMDANVLEVSRALLKCEREVATTYNWRLVTLMYTQLEMLPKCLPSDLIYMHFVPMAISRVMHGRPIPVRVASGRLFLIFLRYNTKPMQRVELRSRLYTDLATSPNCYVRMTFVRLMVEAMSIFSSVYFKENFFAVLLSLAEDPVANIRMKVVSLFPILKTLLSIPTDKKLLTTLETNVRHLLNSEKDRDVLSVLSDVVQKLEEVDVKYEGQCGSAKTKLDIDDNRKLEEEKRLAGITINPKTPTVIAVGKKTTSAGPRPRTSTDGSTKVLNQAARDSTSRNSSEMLKTSSMPEIPVTLSDDEFLVDAGIRIPAQLSASRSTSQIPNLQHLNSIDYEDRVKQRTNSADQGKSIRTSVDYKDSLRRNVMKENLDDQQLTKVDARVKRYSAPHGRTRFGFDVSQGRSIDEKLKRNSLILEKDKPKVLHSKCSLDRTKRHSANYGLKLPDSKESKQKLKRHSLEVTDYTTTTERLGRTLRRYSTLDVNHNQGLSKIPLRNTVLSGSRTAPATRASSPVRLGSQLRFDIGNRDSQSSICDKHLTRFSSSDEEVDKLCRMLLHSQTAPNSRSGSPGNRDSRLPIRFLTKKL